MSNPSLEDEIVSAIRRIVRAIDLHSRWLVEQHGLTGPQLVVLREVGRRGNPTTGQLASAVSLSQPTTSGIVSRLEERGFVRRARSPRDRRVVSVELTDAGTKELAREPSLLQERFREGLQQMAGWERHALLAALQRIASMMGVEQVEAAPMLTAGALPGPAPGVEEQGPPIAAEPAVEVPLSQEPVPQEVPQENLARRPSKAP